MEKVDIVVLIFSLGIVYWSFQGRENISKLPYYSWMTFYRTESKWWSDIAFYVSPQRFYWWKLDKFSLKIPSDIFPQTRPHSHPLFQLIWKVMAKVKLLWSLPRPIFKFEYFISTFNSENRSCPKSRSSKYQINLTHSNWMMYGPLTAHMVFEFFGPLSLLSDRMLYWVG
jgi:hypothetical protein